MIPARFETVDAQRAAALVEELTGLYAVVYAEPPYEEGPEQVREFATKFVAETTRPGFRLVVATAGQRLVGAAYGWTMPAGGWFRRADQDPPADIVDRPKLAVMEWLVDPGHRRHGLGRELMHRLLADRGEPWAVLSADPRSAARRMYERAGWRQCGQSTLPWGTRMDILALRLPVPLPPTGNEAPAQLRQAE